MGKGKKRRKDKALKIGPEVPAIIYKASEERTRPGEQPIIIPSDTFEKISEHMLQTVPSYRNVFLSMSEYRIKDVNPAHKVTRESPTHMIIFCLRIIMTDQFHPLGVVQIDKRKDQTDKLVQVWKAFLQDLSILRLIVVGSISPPSSTFHKILSKLTKIPNMKDYTGPITYSVWPYKDIVHLYDYYHLLHATQETFFERNEMCFMASPRSDKKSSDLQLWKATWTDILLVLATQGIYCYYTEDDPDATPIAIFFPDFWKTYKQALKDGVIDTESKESTNRLMELLCPFSTLLHAYKPFICPYDLQMFYDDNEELRCLLASAKFRKMRSSRGSLKTNTQGPTEETEKVPFTFKYKASADDIMLCAEKLSSGSNSSIEISENQMNKIFNVIDHSMADAKISLDEDFDGKSPFDIFLEKLTYDNYDLYLKTSSASPTTISKSPPDIPKSSPVIPKSPPNIPKSPHTIPKSNKEETPKNDCYEALLDDHQYNKGGSSSSSSAVKASNSVIYSLVKEYFGEAIKDLRKSSLQKSEMVDDIDKAAVGEIPINLKQIENNENQPITSVNPPPCCDQVTIKNIGNENQPISSVNPSPCCDQVTTVRLKNIGNNENISNKPQPPLEATIFSLSSDILCNSDGSDLCIDLTQALQALADEYQDDSQLKITVVNSFDKTRIFLERLPKTLLCETTTSNIENPRGSKATRSDKYPRKRKFKVKNSSFFPKITSSKKIKARRLKTRKNVNKSLPILIYDMIEESPEKYNHGPDKEKEGEDFSRPDDASNNTSGTSEKLTISDNNMLPSAYTKSREENKSTVGRTETHSVAVKNKTNNSRDDNNVYSSGERHSGSYDTKELEKTLDAIKITHDKRRQELQGQPVKPNESHKNFGSRTSDSDSVESLTELATSVNPGSHVTKIPGTHKVLKKPRINSEQCSKKSEKKCERMDYDVSTSKHTVKDSNRKSSEFNSVEKSFQSSESTPSEHFKSLDNFNKSTKIENLIENDVEMSNESESKHSRILPCCTIASSSGHIHSASNNKHTMEDKPVLNKLKNGIEPSNFKGNELLKNTGGYDDCFISNDQMENEEPGDGIEYKVYRKFFENCDPQESKCDTIYKDKKTYESLYNQIPEDFETLRLTTDWLCTFKGYVKLKEKLMSRKVRHFLPKALSTEHVDFFVYLIKGGRNNASSHYRGPTYRLLDYRNALTLLSIDNGIYIIKNDEDVNNMSF